MRDLDRIGVTAASAREAIRLAQEYAVADDSRRRGLPKVGRVSTHATRRSRRTVPGSLCMGGPAHKAKPLPELFVTMTTDSSVRDSSRASTSRGM